MPRFRPTIAALTRSYNQLSRSQFRGIGPNATKCPTPENLSAIKDDDYHSADFR